VVILLNSVVSPFNPADAKACTIKGEEMLLSFVTAKTLLEVSAKCSVLPGIESVRAVPPLVRSKVLLA